MKIFEIEKALGLSRAGLNWLLHHRADELKGHAVQNPKTKRWSIDDEGFRILKEIRKQSTRVIVDPIGDEAVRNTLKDLQYRVRQLEQDNRILNKKVEYGKAAITMVEGITLAMEETAPKIVFEKLTNCVKEYRRCTTDRAVKKALREKEKKNVKDKTAQEEGEVEGQTSLPGF